MVLRMNNSLTSVRRAGWLMVGRWMPRVGWLLFPVRKGGWRARGVASAAGLALAVCGMGCGGQGGKVTEEEKVDAGLPKYASPWDRPIGSKGPPVEAGTGQGKPVRNKTLQEMLRSTDPDASATEANRALIASQFQVGDGAGFGLGADENGAGAGSAEARGAETGGEQRAGGTRLDVAAQAGWTIVIVGFDAKAEGEKAAAALEQVRGVAGLGAAVLEVRGAAAVVTYGRYASPEDEKARADLKRVKEMVVGGVLPFSGATLAPPLFEAIGGTLPRFDLRNVKAMHGTEAVYTLQIAVYCRLDDVEPSAKELGEFRTAAEKAVVELRRTGETAFYYHGPRRSSVTVGLFGTKDYDVRKPRQQSVVLMGLRGKYPTNITNGAELKRKRAGQTQSTADPSFIVAVP